MIRIVEKKLKEISFTPYDVPENFYVVTNYPQDISIEDLDKGILDGVTGISDTGVVLLHFFTVARNIVIKMDGQETAQKNNLTRVMYDNPHYLVSNNLYALSRMYQKELDWKKGRFEGVMGNFLRQLASELSLDGWMRDAIVVEPGFEAKNTVPRDVNSVYDFIEYLRLLFESTDSRDLNLVLEDITENELEKAVFSALESIGEIYKEEGEWIVKNKYLSLPSKDGIAIIMATPPVYKRWKNDELSTADKQALFFNRSEGRLEEIKQLEDYCNTKGIAFYMIDSQEFKDFQGKVLSARSGNRLYKLMQRYTFI